MLVVEFQKLEGVAGGFPVFEVVFGENFYIWKLWNASEKICLEDGVFKFIDKLHIVTDVQLYMYIRMYVQTHKFA